MSDWISVDERLPKDDYPVLCFCKSGGQIIARYTHDWRNWKVSHFIEITHWMPPPKPPIE